MGFREDELQAFRAVQDHILDALRLPDHDPLRPPRSIEEAKRSLHGVLPEEGLGLQRTVRHLLEGVAPGLDGSSLSPRYYGFVTGGITPAARLADNLVTLYDENVQVHLPSENIATTLEDRALRMLLELLDFTPDQWPVRALTTGATASNVCGLACGRDYVISEKLERAGSQSKQGEGLLASCSRAGIDGFQILTTSPHSSLGKAANVVGVGSDAMIDVTRQDTVVGFDLRKLEAHLRASNRASIVVVSCGEVNTGGYATDGLGRVREIRRLCDEHGAWLHVDGAFGIFARALPAAPRFEALRACVAGLELADSIAADGHKLLNVPYDCGVFLAKHARVSGRTFQNANAAYLASAPAADGIVSPSNLRLENSSRLRALPVYSSLVAHGRRGYAAMFERMADLSRAIAAFIRDECPRLELLPHAGDDAGAAAVFVIVLFRARDAALNESLTERIKGSRRIYASGTRWAGAAATRFAVAKWDVDVERDLEIVKQLLREVA